jgi:hypothetical protein
MAEMHRCLPVHPGDNQRHIQILGQETLRRGRSSYDVALGMLPGKLSQTTNAAEGSNTLALVARAKYASKEGAHVMCLEAAELDTDHL